MWWPPASPPRSASSSATPRALDFEPEFAGEGVEEVAVDRRSGRRLLEVSAEFFRPAEVELLVGDASRARARLGWAPKVGVAELAAMMARADYDALG